MKKKDLNWKADTKLPTGEGATKERFKTNDGEEDLSIETRPWGEGDLTADGQEVAHVEGDTDGPEAFRDLDKIAGEYETARDAFGPENAKKQGKKPAKQDKKPAEK